MWYDFIKSNNFVDIYIKSLEEFNYRSRSYRLDRIYDNKKILKADIRFL